MSIKKFATVFALVASVAATAAELELVENEEAEIDYGPRSYGWTSLAVGLATPVQLPWGIDKWDVFGLDLNLGYSDAPRMFGWQVALGANVARKDFGGIATALGFNFSNKDAYGLDVALLNMNNFEYYGVCVDAVGVNRGFYGVSVDLLGNMTSKEMKGVSVAGIASAVKGDMYGAEISLGANFARNANGFQGALLYNQTAVLWGFQLGLVNYAAKCDHGLQIGLVNIIMDNQVPFFPFVNFYFD